MQSIALGHLASVARRSGEGTTPNAVTISHAALILEAIQALGPRFPMPPGSDESRAQALVRLLEQHGLEDSLREILTAIQTRKQNARRSAMSDGGHHARPIADVKAVRAKLFRNGGSQAVRLPRECRLPEGESEVMVRREGRRVILEPVDAWSGEFLNALGSVSGESPRPKQLPFSKLENPFGARGVRSRARSARARRDRGAT
jgi:virulence-associated protein VagC